MKQTTVNHRGSMLVYGDDGAFCRAGLLSYPKVPFSLFLNPAEIRLRCRASGPNQMITVTTGRPLFLCRRRSSRFYIAFVSLPVVGADSWVEDRTDFGTHRKWFHG